MTYKQQESLDKPGTTGYWLLGSGTIPQYFAVLQRATSTWTVPRSILHFGQDVKIFIWGQNIVG